MTVSVIVPAYNAERFLDQCLDSLRAQTLRDIEIVCVDDGSTDATGAMLARHAAADDRVKVISKPNTGYGDTMNRGLDAATGAYVGILEADDFLDPDALRVLLAAAVAQNADVAKANYFHYWSTPVPRDELVQVFDPAIAGQLLTDPAAQSDIIFQPPSIWSAIYRRDFLRRAGIDFLATPGASFQDSSFAFKVWASAPRTVLVEQAFLHYRQDNADSSIHAIDKARCIRDEYAEMARFLAARPELPARLEAARQLMRHNTYLWYYDRLDAPLRQEFLVGMSRELRADYAAGRLDLSQFDPLRKASAMAILRTPRAFHRSRQAAGRGLVARALHYARIGGLQLPLDLAAYRLRGRGGPVLPEGRAPRS